MRIILQPSFILHHRPFRETSVLLDVLTRDHGRISLIAKGVRKQRSVIKALLQPFNALLISWHGKSELMTLTAVESQGAPLTLKGDSLLSGFYLNELLVRVLPKQDPCLPLYTFYHETLLELAQGLKPKILRLFEKKLLEEIGYGLQLTHDFVTQMPIEPDKYYRYYPDQGFQCCDVEGPDIFLGKNLLAFAQEALDDEMCLRDAKRLMRLVLTPLLGSKPLESRKLFT